MSYIPIFSLKPSGSSTDAMEYPQDVDVATSIASMDWWKRSFGKVRPRDPEYVVDVLLYVHSARMCDWQLFDEEE